MLPFLFRLIRHRVEPGPVQKQLTKTKEKVSDLLPEKFKEISADTIKKASDWAVIQKVMEKAGQGTWFHRSGNGARNQHYWIKVKSGRDAEHCRDDERRT